MTSWTGRLLGMLLGAFIFGPLGLVLGLFIGYLYDIGWLRKWYYEIIGQKDRGNRSYTQQIFFDTTFSVMGYIAKADGRVTEKDIAVAKAVMKQLELDDSAKKRAIESFNIGKQSNFNLDGALNTLKRACWYKPALLKFFLDTQIQMAQANGGIGPRAKQVIDRICQHFGIVASPFQQQYQYQNQQSSGYSSNYQRSNFSSSNSLDEAYRLLGIAKDATDAEVKKAYRRQMSANHPDRLIAKGVPEEMIKLATQKTQQIKQAYEEICRARGLK